MKKHLKIVCAAFLGFALVFVLGFTGYQEIDRSGIEEYQPADVDSDSTTCYYGFVDMSGGWYILKKTTSGGDDSYRYAKGNSAYTTRWAARESDTTFDYFYMKF